MSINPVSDNNWLAEIIMDMMQKCPEHLNTFWGERDCGSKWGTEFNLRHLLDLKWYSLRETSDHPPDGKIKVFQALITSDEFNATERITMVGDIEPEDADSVSVRRGPHGNLQLEMPEKFFVFDEVNGYETDIATMIIGPHEDVPMAIYTVYPGQYTAALPNYDTHADLLKAFHAGEIPGDCAVKWTDSMTAADYWVHFLKNIQ